MSLAIVGLVGLGHAEPVRPDVRVEAQVRPRFEAHTGRDQADGGDTAFVTQRARLGATLTVDKLDVRVVLQDVRNWGAEGSVLDFSADGIDANVATLTYHPSEDVWVRVGRQAFKMHEERLIGALEWASQARRFDGVQVHVERGPWSSDLAGALTATPIEDRSGVSAMGWFRGGYQRDTTVADVVYIFDGTPERRMHTAGLYATAASGVFSGRVESYVQASGAGVGAMAGLRGTLRADTDLAPSITLWYDILSGATADGGAAFDTLYDTRHKFYGLADIVAFTQGAATDGRGLQDIAVKGRIKPTPQSTVGLDLHAFLAAPGSTGTSSIGQEVDVFGSVEVVEKLGLSGGASYFRSPDGDDGWGFVMVDLKLK